MMNFDFKTILEVNVYNDNTSDIISHEQRDFEYFYVESKTSRIYNEFEMNEVILDRFAHDGFSSDMIDSSEFAEYAQQLVDNGEFIEYRGFKCEDDPQHIIIWRD